MQLNTKTSILLVIFVIAISGGFVFILYSDRDQPSEFDPSVITPSVILGEGYERFTHPVHPFSVEYPINLEVLRYEEENDMETVVFQQGTDTDNTPLLEKNGFQIFIIPFGDEEFLTRERIVEDVPSVIIEDLQEVIIGSDTHALLFWSEDPDIGRTREVWFTHSGNLYEVTTYAHLDLWLAKILSTWKFEGE